MELANIDQTEAAPALARFTIEPAALGDAVAYLAKRIIDTRRARIPLVVSIAFRADLSGRVTLTATDFDIDASVTLPAAVESPGEFCTNAAALSDVLAKVRKDKGRHAVAFQDGERLEVKSGRNVFKLHRMPVDDFPAIPVDASPLPVTFDAPAARFLADLAALAPCISKEGNRYYLNGIAIQVRNLGGRDRFAMIATDGHKIGIASRELPQGADLMPDCLMPRKVVDALRHAEKLALTCDALTVELDPARGGGLFRLTLGAVSIVAKAIDGTFPDWQRLFDDGNLSPTGEALPMFPELLPAAPLHSMQAIEKAVKSPVIWEPAKDGMIGTLPDDTGLMFGAVSNTESAREPVKGYRVSYDSDASAAFSYLTAIADQKAGAHVTRDNCRLQVHAGEVQGLTVGDCTWHNSATVWSPGAYSIVMPRDRAKLMPDASLMIDGDSTLYPLGINSGNTIHLSKDQVRAIVGESCFETMALTIAGRVIYILRWLFEQGDSRFLTVRADGRCFTGKDAGKAMYLSRGQVEVALRGEVEPEAAPMPEIASPAPAQEESAPIAAQEGGEVVNALTEAESPPVELLSETLQLPDAPAADLAAITARLDALEQALATLSAVSVTSGSDASNEGAEINKAPTARAMRTPAHERAIRRAWAERKARRDADAYRMMMERSIDENGKMFDRELAQVRAELDLARQSTQQREKERDKWEADCRTNFAHAGKMSAKRRATAQRARRMIAAARARADLDKRALAITNATLSRLKRDMADPMQPERASDIARLVGERDTARTALAAMAARAERAEQTVNAMADRFEGLVSRVTRAEAALRQANAA